MDEVCIDGVSFPTLVAVTDREQSRGLMYQKWPPPVMTFPYKNASVRKFWMHNTPSPLDIVFCRNNKVIQICAGQPFSTTLVGPDEPADLVIELPSGTAEKHGFTVGSIISTKYSAESASKLIKMSF